MASLIVQENGAPRTKPAVNGEEITIQAPCDCSAVTGVMIAGVVFPFYDACGNNVSNIDGKFGSGSLIRVMIDTINTRSYILNQASPVEKFHAAHHAAGGDDPITPTAIGAQNRLAWVTETSIDAMFSGTYSGEEDESAEASSAVLAAIADLQEQVGELEDEIREVAENVTGEPCDCSKYDAIASAEAARQSAEAASQSAESARQNAIAAGGLATQAVASANLADQRATETERYAARAEQAIGKTSYIGDDGNWYEWDVLQNDFTNTGVRAQGDPGIYYGTTTPPTDGSVKAWINPDGCAANVFIMKAVFTDRPSLWEWLEKNYSKSIMAFIVFGQDAIKGNLSRNVDNGVRCYSIYTEHVALPDSYDDPNNIQFMVFNISDSDATKANNPCVSISEDAVKGDIGGQVIVPDSSWAPLGIRVTIYYFNE